MSNSKAKKNIVKTITKNFCNELFTRKGIAIILAVK